MRYVYYQPDTNTLGVSHGDFLQFYWNGKLGETYLPILEEEGYWIRIGEYAKGEGDE